MTKDLGKKFIKSELKRAIEEGRGILLVQGEKIVYEAKKIVSFNESWWTFTVLESEHKIGIFHYSEIRSIDGTGEKLVIRLKLLDESISTIMS